MNTILAASLLNLTGLGLGYAYLHRWRRWLFHLFAMGGLALIAFWMNAAHSPLFWLFLFGLCLLWMTLDGGRLARRWPKSVAAGEDVKRWGVLAFAVLLLALEGASLLGYVALGQWEFGRGRTAYQAANCREALPRFNRVTTVYRLTLNPNVVTAEGRIVECSLFVVAENAHLRGEYAEAITAYEAYLSNFADMPAAEQARLAAGDLYTEWATQLQTAGEYELGIEKLKLLFSKYPDTAPGGQAPVNAAVIYEGWAADLRKRGQPEEAIAKYQIILDDYAKTPAAARVRVEMAEAHVEWAAELRAAKEYETAVEKYQLALAGYAADPAALHVRTSLAETYTEWGTQLRASGEHEAAVEKYQIALDNYADEPSATQTRITIAEIYIEWASSLQGNGRYQEAIQKYNLVGSEYADTPSAAPAKKAVVAAYLEWGEALEKSGNFAAAIRTFNIVVEDFPDTEAADVAQAAIGPVYNAWGGQLRTERHYLEAMEKFTTAKEISTAPEVAAAAETGYEAALKDLSQDTSGEGKTLLQQTRTDACNDQLPTSPAINLAKDEPGKALSCDSEITLPVELEAVKPAHFRYVVSLLETGISDVERCRYTLNVGGSATLIRQQIWWRVSVRNVSTGRVVAERVIRGTAPDFCPNTRYFNDRVEYEVGGPPSESAIADWLQDVLR